MSEMKHDSAFQAEHESALADHRAERAKAAAKASDEKVATPGFPVALEGGGEVMIVRKAFEGQRLVMIAADGSRYVRNYAGRCEALASEPVAEPVAVAVAEETEGGDSE